MLSSRETIQKEAVDAFMFQAGGRGTIVAGTGTGKSKIAIDIIDTIIKQENNTIDILLLTNSETLRDKNWYDEFTRWGQVNIYDKSVTSWTYQKAYKEKGYWDLIIFDEVDFACTPEYGKCFQNLKSKYALGLTGFLPPEKEEFLNQYLPVCYRAETQALQESGVLNKSEFILINFPLSKEKNIEKKVRKTGAKFYTSENDEYKYWDKEFQKAMIVKTSLDKQVRLGFPVKVTDLTSAEWNFKIKASKRKSILNTLNSSVKVVQNLVKHIHSTKGNKIVVFSALTDQADKFGFPTYHGKSNSTEKGLDRLNKGEINTLAVCKAINRGINIVDLNYIIREGYDSSQTDFSQIHGRGLRLKANQIMKFIILIPQYEDFVKTENGSMKKMMIKTQASRWAEKSMSSFNTEGITRTITLDSSLEIKSGMLI